MSLQTKASLYNFFSFLLLFVIFRALVFQNLMPEVSNIIKAILAGICTTVIAPKFAAIKTEDGPALFVKWIFKKQPKRIQ